MRQRAAILLVWAAALCLATVEGFQVGRPISSISTIVDNISSSIHPSIAAGRRLDHATFLFRPKQQPEEKDDDNNTNDDEKSNTIPRRRKRRYLRRKLRFGLAVLLGAAASSSQLVTTRTPPAAHAASAPIMAMPKAEGRDPATEAITFHERKMAAAKQAELNEFSARARKIEATQGERARIKFEKDYKRQQEEIAAEKTEGLVQLKRDLLDQGICPFTDLEGQRQVLLYNKGVDLAKVPGTQFNLERTWEEKTPAKSMKVKKAMHRRVIQAMVQDMKNRDIDPLEYFEKHQDQTQAILNDMSSEQATRLVQQYQANLERYGQITVPKEGEPSALEIMAKKNAPDPKAAKKAAREEAKRVKAEAAAAAKAAKREAKELAQAAKRAAKEEAAKFKEQQKTQQAGAAAAASAVAGAASSAGSAVGGVADSVREAVGAPSGDDGAPSSSGESFLSSEGQGESTEGSSSSSNSGSEKGAVVTTSKSKKGSVLPAASVLPATAATIAVVGGGGFAFKLYRDRSEASEEQRRRELMLLLGGTDPNGSSDNNNKGKGASSSASVLDTDTSSTESKVTDTTAATPKNKSSSSEPTAGGVEPPPPAPKKKRLGIKSVFGSKKKSNRETDLMVLVAPDAKAPVFTTTLAKILTYGAPGRFPAVVALPGGDQSALEAATTPTFDLEAAKQLLVDAQQDAGLTVEESAEIFANVVNCMLIDIVDLASSTLKEKDSQLTVDAINIILDFMNHAATLYDSIAQGVAIKPVVYGGDLSKSKLEQMFSEYAGSATLLDMENIPTDFDSRVSLLQDVFEINDKKAEGLTMRAMQKSMAEAMKDPKKMEALEEMMQGMGGMEGMEGMASLMGGGADGEEVDPEQLKVMLRTLKDLKDSGSIPPEELENVKNEFKKSFGSSIDDVVKEASTSPDDLTENDKELLELMKSIMD